jgi:hypothetical protein
MRYFVAFSLILMAALSRLLPHTPNVVPITALALFSGVYLQKKYAVLVPMAAMLVSDWFLGFSWGTPWVYASFIAIGLIGLWLRKHRGIAQTAGASLIGSVLFYAVTNLGVWVSSGMYPHSMAGLAECYVAAIPFFRNTVLGDLAYVGAMFTLFSLAKRLIPAMEPEIPRTEA